MNNLAKSGDLRIETIRGLAILAVVAHHAGLMLTARLTELQLEPGLMRDVAGAQSGLFEPVRMPLFTLLSGWVYALRPVTRETFGIFLGGKFRRIIIPLFFVSTVKYFHGLYVNSAYPVLPVPEFRPVLPDEFWLSWFFQFGHLWFLHVIFVLFIVVMLIDLAGKMKTVRQWVFWLGIAALLPYVMPKTQFWSLAKVPEIMVFFIAGVGINRFSHLWKSKGAISLTWAVFLVSMLIHVYWKLSDEPFDPWPHFLLAGISAPLCALSLNFQWKPLIWIGGYSFSIYLYHSIVIKSFPWADRLLASPEMQIVWFAGALGVAILLPILIDFTVRGVPYARTLIVGRKPRSARRIPEPAPGSPILPDPTGLHAVMPAAGKK